MSKHEFKTYFIFFIEVSECELFVGKIKILMK